MARQKVSFGILIFLGFVLVTFLYLFVMSGTADVRGNIKVSSQLVSWEENPPGVEDAEMLAVNGYCIKGADTDNRLLLSTKNKHGTDKLKYSFTAKEGMRHVIVVYLQLDHLTGDLGQTMDLQFMTNTIRKGDLKCDFNINFKEIDGVQVVAIEVKGTGYKKPLEMEYNLSEIPGLIKI